ncbi:hypothetical protein ACQP60_05530 [Isoptericola variabilis]|uniref:hypothetical protein n=1 Tax=Isoptericola variabilis TaxID=139208 RepID=UPI003D215D30
MTSPVEVPGRALGGWPTAIGVGLVTGLLVLPAGYYSIVLTWTAGGAGVLFVAAVLAGISALSAHLVGRAGGRASMGAIAPLLGSAWFLLLLVDGSLWHLSMLLSGLLAATVAAAGMPRTRRAGRWGTALLAGVPAIVVVGSTVVDLSSSLTERAAEFGRPYLLSGDYDESYVAMGYGTSEVAYAMPDDGELLVVSGAALGDPVVDAAVLTLGGCVDESDVQVRCSVEGAPFPITLYGVGGVDEAALADAVGHLHPMSKWSFYSNAKRYLEVFPG